MKGGANTGVTSGMRIFLACLCFAAAVHAAPVKIFILSGQSNMTGRGALGDLKNRPRTRRRRSSATSWSR